MKTREYDVAVVGLGAMGAAALYQLSKTGLNVIGIDKYTPPHAFGSSFGETRVTRQAIAEGNIYTPLVLRANKIWEELEALSGEELFVRCGMVLAAQKKSKFFQKTLQAAAHHSIPHEIIASDEIGRRFPAINAAGADSTFYYEPEAGYLRPEKCIDVQLKLAQANGAHTLFNTEVTNIVEGKTSTSLRLNSNEILIAKKVIIASGPWIKDMLPDVLGPILKTHLQTLYWFAIDTEHANKLKVPHMPVFLCGDEITETTRSFYGFPLVGGANGGIKFAVHETSKEVAPEEKDSVVSRTSGKEVYSFVSLYINHIKPKTLQATNCLYTMTPDQNFIIDFKPDNKNVVLISACSGHGFKYSAAIGELAARMVIKEKTDIDIGPFALERFK